MKNKKIFLKLFILLAVFGLGVFQADFVLAVCPDDPQCLTPIQITHPAHHVILDGFTSRNPWNFTMDKIFLRELPICFPRGNVNPDCNSLNDGSPKDYTQVNPYWAYLDDLMAVSGGTVNQYEAVRHQIFPNGNYYTYGALVVWGNTLATKDIVYGVRLSDQMLIKADTSTIPSNIVELTRVPDINETQFESFKVFDWTTDGNLIIINDYSANYTRSGYEVNVNFTGTLNCNLTTPTIEANGCKKYTSWPANCAPDNNRFASYHPQNEHYANFTDNYIRFQYGADDGSSGNGAAINDATSPNCNPYNYKSYGEPGYKGADWPDIYTIGSGSEQYRNSPTHCSGSTALSTIYGYTNNDWAVCGTMPHTWGRPGGHTNCSDPYLDSFSLYKIAFNRNTHEFTRTELVSHATTGYVGPDGCYPDNYAQYDNYIGGIMNPVLRRDSRQVMYLASNNNYSLWNYNWCKDGHGGSACPAILAGQNEGMSLWIVDLAPVDPGSADVDGSGSVNIKDIQACIKVITGTDTRYQNQCKVLAAPTDRTNIKDIQVIIQKILNP